MSSGARKHINQQKHWDRIGTGYDDTIFDVFASDTNQVLANLIATYGSRSKTAIDFGCGTGKAFSLLSPNFKSVLGIDISKELLKVAAGRGFTNVTLRQGDLTRSLVLPKADFAFCCNVIMLESMDRNLRMFKNVYRALKPGGHAIVVVPSLESFFYVANRLIEWHRRDGTPLNRIDSDEFKGFAVSKRELINGVVKIDGVPTKHYLMGELQAILSDVGFSQVATHELRYEWTTEFAEPPAWMKGPYPWDWLVYARKK